MSTPTTIPGEVRPEQDCPDGSTLVTLQYQRVVVCSLGEVWTALTDPESLSRWYGTYTGDPTTGWIRLTMTDQHDTNTTDVRVVKCTPPTDSSSISTDGCSRWHCIRSARSPPSSSPIDTCHGRRSGDRSGLAVLPGPVRGRVGRLPAPPVGRVSGSRRRVPHC